MTITRERVAWPAVILFYGVACAISWPFVWWRDVQTVSWEAWQVPATVKILAPASGPAIGALCALFVFRKKHRRTVTIGGTSWPRSLAFAAFPAALIITLGIGSQQPHLTALFFVQVHVIAAFAQELGWRGFLQDALAPLPPRTRYVLIGMMWGVWHLAGNTQGGLRIAGARLTLMFALWIASSWWMGRVVERSRSLLVATIIHLVVIFSFGEYLTLKRSLFVFGLSCAALFFLLRGWPEPERSS